MSTLAPHPHGQKTDPCLKKHVHVDIVCTLHRNPVWIIVSDRNPKYITWSGSSCGSPYKRDKSKGLKLRIQQVTAAARSAVALKPSSIILFFSNRNGLSSIVCNKLKDEFGATEFPLDFPVLDFNFDISKEAGEWTNVLVARTYQEACAFEIKVSDTRNAVLSSESDVKDSSLGEAADTEKDLSVSTEHTEFCCAFSNFISRMEFYSLYLRNGQSAQVGSLLGQSELINFDTTALIALVSGISNGGIPKLLATPESELRQRFKGNYEFVIGQVSSSWLHLLFGVLAISFHIAGEVPSFESFHPQFRKIGLILLIILSKLDNISYYSKVYCSNLLLHFMLPIKKLISRRSYCSLSLSLPLIPLYPRAK